MAFNNTHTRGARRPARGRTVQFRSIPNRPPTRELSEEECWRLIEAAPYGRIAAAAGGEVDIFPVNHKVDDGPDGRAIVFRTQPGTKLLELTIHANVAFEVMP